MSGKPSIYHRRPPAFSHTLRHATTGVDTRAVIYGHAFADELDLGLIPVEAFADRVESVVLARPQLIAINGRPC